MIVSSVEAFPRPGEILPHHAEILPGRAETIHSPVLRAAQQARHAVIRVSADRSGTMTWAVTIAVIAIALTGGLLANTYRRRRASGGRKGATAPSAI